MGVLGPHFKNYFLISGFLGTMYGIGVKEEWERGITKEYKKTWE